MGHTGLVKRLCIVGACLLVIVSCSRADESEDVEPVEVPSGFVVPDGLDLTSPDEDLQIGDPATVILGVDDLTSSVVTITPAAVEQGSTDDLRGFTLGEEFAGATPYYVQIEIENLGPAGIGGAAVPLYVDLGVDGEVSPPTSVIGAFGPCEVRVLPESLLPQESTELCLVYLAPAGSAPQGFEFITAADDRLTWEYAPPADSEDADSGDAGDAPTESPSP